MSNNWEEEFEEKFIDIVNLALGFYSVSHPKREAECLETYQNIKSFIRTEIEKTRESGIQSVFDNLDLQIDNAKQQERQALGEKILTNLSHLKRWVATINGVDEYVVRDKDLNQIIELIKKEIILLK